MKARRICVFCGSNSGKNPLFEKETEQLGQRIAQKGLELVYGGAHVGLMGRVADAALAAGGHVIGIIPQALVEWEVAHKKIQDLRVVHSMSERKQLMFDLSDAFIALPGGLGTLDELFEVWTWRALQSHNKPCGLINPDNYYDDFLGFLAKVQHQNFVSSDNLQYLQVETSAEELLDRLISGFDTK